MDWWMSYTVFGALVTMLLVVYHIYLFLKLYFIYVLIACAYLVSLNLYNNVVLCPVHIFNWNSIGEDGFTVMHFCSLLLLYYVFCCGERGFSQSLQLLGSPNLRRHVTTGSSSEKHLMRITWAGQLKVKKVLNVQTKYEHLYRIMWWHSIFFTIYVFKKKLWWILKEKCYCCQSFSNLKTGR